MRRMIICIPLRERVLATRAGYRITINCIAVMWWVSVDLARGVQGGIPPPSITPLHLLSRRQHFACYEAKSSPPVLQDTEALEKRSKERLRRIWI